MLSEQKWKISRISTVFMSNATITNYFAIYLQNVDVANFLLVFIYFYH